MDGIMNQNPHYQHDEQTGLITFNREHRYYQIERTVFASKGVDIDRIKTFEQYFDFIIAFRYEVRVAFHRYIENKKPKTIESKFTQSVIPGDKKEIKRLEPIIDKMKQLHIKVNK